MSSYGLKAISAMASRVTICLLGVTVLTGCSPDVAKRLDYGTERSNFRFELVLAEPMEQVELFHIVRMLAERNGFGTYVTDSFTPESMDDSIGRHVMIFRNTAGDGRPERSVSGLQRYKMTYTWESDGSGSVGTVWFIFQLDGIGEFRQQEWIEFRRWRNEILPSAMNIRELIVRIHPAEFTYREDIQAFSEASDVAVPERYQ